MNGPNQSVEQPASAAFFLRFESSIRSFASFTYRSLAAAHSWRSLFHYRIFPCLQRECDALTAEAVGFEAAQTISMAVPVKKQSGP